MEYVLKGLVHPNYLKVYFMTCLLWHPAMLILFAKVLRFLLPPQYSGGLFVVLKAEM